MLPPLGWLRELTYMFLLLGAITAVWTVGKADEMSERARHGYYPAPPVSAALLSKYQRPDNPQPAISINDMSSAFGE
jgi:hypothetical protein